MTNVVLHRLLKKYPVTEEADKFHEICRVAMLIHLCGTLNSWLEFRKIRDPLNIKILRRLLIEVSGNWIKDGLRDLKLWMLFVGVADAVEDGDKAWFTNELRKLIPPGSYLSRWEDIEDVLKGFWWAGNNSSMRYQTAHGHVFAEEEELSVPIRERTITP
jgi:hypothetical protein